MTQTLFVSERSFAGQAGSFHRATKLLIALAETIQALKPRLATDRPLRVHSELRQSKLTATVTLQDWLSKQPADRVTAGVRKELFQLLSRGPHFDSDDSDERSSANAKHCVVHGSGSDVDVTGSSVAAAACCQGWLACLSGADEFSKHPLTVLVDGEIQSVPNFSAVCQVEALRLIYKANDEKHHPNSYGRRSVMDLPESEAEALLNKSVPADGKKQRYGVLADTLYEFQPDGTGAYHGYRIERDQELMEVPLDVRERLGRVR